MTTETLDSVIAEVEEKLPGWEWLVRRDQAQGGWFANILSPDFKNGIVIIQDGVRMTPDMEGRTYPSRSTHSAARALRNALLCVDPLFFETDTEV